MLVRIGFVFSSKKIKIKEGGITHIKLDYYLRMHDVKRYVRLRIRVPPAG